jgi:hypothetical protein
MHAHCCPIAAPRGLVWSIVDRALSTALWRPQLFVGGTQLFGCGRALLLLPLLLLGGVVRAARRHTVSLPPPPPNPSTHHPTRR